MRIAILGAAGRTGRRVAEQAVARGHHVRALVRGTSTPEGLSHRSIEIVRGDATDADAVSRLVEGCDAVVVALGPSRRSVIMSGAAARNVVRACHEHGVSTVVSLSGALVPMPNERRGLYERTRWAIVSGLARPITNDKIAERDALIGSGLRWVIVRPSRLVDRPEMSLSVSDDKPANGYLSRDVLATFMLDQAENPTYAGKAPYLSA